MAKRMPGPEGGCRRIVLPKGFPPAPRRREGEGGGALWRRLPGPAGALALHGALVALIFHFQVLNEVFGRRPAEPMDWTSLPEVMLVEAAPEPPPPEPPVEPEPEPEPEPEVVVPPEPEPEPEEEPVKEWQEPLPEPVVEESPVVVPEAPKPEPEVRVAQEPVSAPPEVAEVAPSRQRDAWEDVRAGIMRELRYPARAREGRIEGVVVVVLSLDEAGAVKTAEIREPSPGVVLSEAAIRAVMRAGPFPEAGEAIRRGETPATAEMAIRFELRRAGS